MRHSLRRLSAKDISNDVDISMEGNQKPDDKLSPGPSAKTESTMNSIIYNNPAHHISL